MTRLGLLGSCLLAAALDGRLPAQEAVTAEAAAAHGTRWALVIAGLPGDEEHRRLFRSTTERWVSWLTGGLQFEPQHVIVLGPEEARLAAERTGDQSPTKAQVREAAGRIADQLREQDVLWVFLLGHADHDGQRAWFHLPGPDLNEQEFAELFAPVRSRQQVFWLTNTCSGWFLRPLSREGRIVITATEPGGEVNETEFPHALATVAGRSAESADLNADGRVSLAELFQCTVAEVNNRFAADNRIPTEHAQLDDDGDGEGTEPDELAHAPAQNPAESAGGESSGALRRDGGVAAQTFLPFPAQNKQPSLQTPIQP